jgi:hypothetical protein
LKGGGQPSKKTSNDDDIGHVDLKSILKSIAKGDDPRAMARSPRVTARSPRTTPPKRGDGSVEYVNYDYEPMYHAGCCYDDTFVPSNEPAPSGAEDPDAVMPTPDEEMVYDKSMRHAYI